MSGFGLGLELKLGGEALSLFAVMGLRHSLGIYAGSAQFDAVGLRHPLGMCAGSAQRLTSSSRVLPSLRLEIGTGSVLA